MKITEKKVVAIIHEYCASLRTITKIRMGIFPKRIELSIDAKGNPKGKRLQKVAKKIEKMVRKLEKTFPGRRVECRIWPENKKSLSPKGSKPFEDKDIIIITAPVRREFDTEIESGSTDASNIDEY